MQWTKWKNRILISTPLTQKKKIVDKDKSLPATLIMDLDRTQFPATLSHCTDLFKTVRPKSQKPPKAPHLSLLSLSLSLSLSTLRWENEIMRTSNTNHHFPRLSTLLLFFFELQFPGIAQRLCHPGTQCFSMDFTHRHHCSPPQKSC